LKLDGTDPISERRAQRNAARLDAAKDIWFSAFAEKYVTTHAPAWRNPKSEYQWRATLKNYANPMIGCLPLAAIDTARVMSVLQPLWETKVETGSRLRGRLERILDAAKAQGLRTGDNPAAWSNLKALLPPVGKVKKEIKHHPALPYAKVPAFMARLRKFSLGIGAPGRDALEFLILTASRTSEVINADWDELDLDARTWSIPGRRMKSGKPHRVPLCERAVEILRGQRYEIDGHSGHVFEDGEGKRLGGNALREVLQELHLGLTVHGFRSTFRDWCAEQTSFSHQVCELALAHSVGTATERAYQRSDQFEKRRKLMDAWAAYCEKPVADADVIRLRRS
jgi:integrase